MPPELQQQRDLWPQAVARGELLGQQRQQPLLRRARPRPRALEVEPEDVRQRQSSSASRKPSIVA